jgi:hypothetical protein
LPIPATAKKKYSTLRIVLGVYLTTPSYEDFMHLHKSILSILTVTSLASHSANLFGQPNPTMTPSTFCVHTNEQVFLYGAGFNPGTTMQGYLISSHYQSPIFGATADTNGQFSVDITFRGNIDMNGPRAVQEYYFAGGNTSTNFHVWYQTYNPTNVWHAVITNMDTYPISAQYQQVDIYAVITTENNYQVQMATNLAGPWNFLGETTTHENPYSNVTFSCQIPPVPNAFFRISNPYVPCPCDF